MSIFARGLFRHCERSEAIQRWGRMPSLQARIVVREWSDDIWVRGAAAMSLRELYGATWSTTGPAKSRNEANGETT